MQGRKHPRRVPKVGLHVASLGERLGWGLFCFDPIIIVKRPLGEDSIRGHLDHVGKEAPKKSTKGRSMCSFSGGKAGVRAVLF